MREYFIVTLSGEVVRRGVVPAGMAQTQPIAEGEVLSIVSREEYLSSYTRTERP